MLAYAEHRRRVAAQRSAPHAMLGIMVAHIAVIAVVMSAKMDLPDRIFNPPITVDTIPLPDPPPQKRPVEKQPEEPRSAIDQPTTFVPMPQPSRDSVDSTPTPIPIPPDLGAGPRFDPFPQPSPPVRIGPRSMTPAGSVRPPYPLEKLKNEEEASLKLRLSIDASGRVISVEPVGRADRAFLQAARRHILAQWRYQPASEDGRPMASSTVITLKFELHS